MNNRTFSKCLLFLMAIIIGLTACKKDNDDNGLMKASIDGDAWKADEVAAVVYPGLINISGKTDDGEVITMTIQSGAVGDYFLSETQPHAAVYQESSNALAFTSNTPEGLGFVNITAIDETNLTISGKFEFNAIRPTDGALKEIRSGEFTDVKYVKEVITSGPNTLTCKIDNQSFTPASVFAVLNSNKIVISSNSADMNKTIGLTLPSNIAMGEFSLTTFGTYTAQYNINQNIFLGADSGKVKVTKHDKAQRKIEGTFNFEASDFIGSSSAVITNGVFSVNY